jgi:hypothetical protein
MHMVYDPYKHVATRRQRTLWDDELRCGRRNVMGTSSHTTRERGTMSHAAGEQVLQRVVAGPNELLQATV